MSAGFVISAEMARRRDLGCAAKLVYAYAARYVTTDDRETGKPGGLEVGEVWLRQRKRAGERPGVRGSWGSRASRPHARLGPVVAGGTGRGLRAAVGTRGNGSSGGSTAATTTASAACTG